MTPLESLGIVGRALGVLESRGAWLWSLRVVVLNVYRWMAVTVSISSSEAIGFVSASTNAGVLCAPSEVGNHLCGEILVAFLNSELTAVGSTESLGMEWLIYQPETPTGLVAMSTTMDNLNLIKLQKPEKFEANVEDQ